MAQEDAHTIAQLLRELDQLSEDEVNGRLGEETPSQCPRSVDIQNPPVEIASIGLITCNRLDGLRRALTSYIQNNKLHGRTNDFVVMDDSSSIETRKAYREMLRSLKMRYGVSISYGGLEDKVHFAKQLINAGDLPPDVVKFALFDVENCRYTYGANRNALLLHTIGDTIFSADDDTVCRVAPAPGLNAGVSFASNCDPRELWFFPDRETALRSIAFVEKDILAVHEELLGKDLGSIIATLGGTKALDLDRIDSRFLRRLESGRGRAVVTLDGLVGDCGWGAPFGYWGAPFGYLLLNGESHERLVRSESDYHSACTSREVLRTVKRITISDGTYCAGTFMGLDNRSLLPPFMPVQRGQDIIFGTTLWMCFEDSYFGHLPYALLHAPVQYRQFWPGEIFRSASGFDTTKLMIACIQSFEFGSGKTSGKERLQALGRYLMELGSMSLRDFEEFASIQARGMNTSFISMMEERLRVCGESPEFWANDVKRYLGLLQKALTREDYWVPLDLIDGRSVDEARELSQRLVRKFGELLYWWPHIVEAARGLRAQGKTLAQRL